MQREMGRGCINWCVRIPENIKKIIILNLQHRQYKGMVSRGQKVGQGIQMCLWVFWKVTENTAQWRDRV